ncbi:class I adenylate-forming enzyme family protein [Streptomyces inhibens]|uniref:class I adenylate-forming enzyme family protein n=1 Tax=Streptomyces inhibens TaxID=2293571 RepID=UPI001EE744B3|nr:class I adenylate-forming enzyme family protein [Streptomyces inhibens]UKY51786.1 acyl--CoA ligase [Streptomyces inhibens]
MTRSEPAAAGSVFSGPPLSEIGHLIDVGRVDELLGRTAGRAPKSTALRSPSGDWTYAELDADVDRCASALHRLLGGPDVVIALAAVLDASFAIGYYGISRSGNVSAIVNPFLTEDRLVHVLATSGARAAIVSPEVYRRLAAVRSRLPQLETVVLTARGEDSDAELAALPTLRELLDGAAPAATEYPHGDDVACLQFTSGTTGAAKAARLTHRNLIVNAAQTAYGHRLTESSVVFNYLPTFHLMHLSIAVTAGATHVLWPSNDIAGSVDAANAHRATHYYSLPMRLARLAADPRFTALEAPALRAVLSGGSALAPAVTTALSQHFGVPVVQGYGLAETAPSTHLGDLDNPRIGSSGLPVPGTDCRIVDVETRAVVPIGARGEIQVRGPQLMRGYLGREGASFTDADGWFSTGDIAYVDDAGQLFVVDRLKDVFKCDNWLVSPTEIERILLRHPDVADCVVFDWPDEFSGAVAHAVVVPKSGRETADTAAFAEFVNAKVPYYEQLRHIELVSDIPRSPTGKVQRRELREQFIAGRAGSRPRAN